MKVTTTPPVPVEQTVQIEMTMREATMLRIFLGRMSNYQIQEIVGRQDAGIETMTDDLYYSLKDGGV